MKLRTWILVAVIAVIAVVAIALGAVWSVPWLTDQSTPRRDAISVFAGLVVSVATVATVVFAAIAALSSTASAREARRAAEDARVTLGAHRDTSQLVAAIFLDNELADRVTDGIAATEPIPIKVTLATPFALVDVQVRYQTHGSGDVAVQELQRLGAGEDRKFLMGQLDVNTPYGHCGDVEIRCTDPAYGTRRLAQLRVEPSGRGWLRQQTVTDRQWLIVQAESG